MTSGWSADILTCTSSEKINLSSRSASDTGDIALDTQQHSRAGLDDAHIGDHATLRREIRRIRPFTFGQPRDVIGHSACRNDARSASGQRDRSMRGFDRRSSRLRAGGAVLVERKHLLS